MCCDAYRLVCITCVVTATNTLGSASATSNVITLLANVTYYFTTTVDLLGDRIVCSANTVILGASSENCVLKSTGLNSSTALITSVYSLPIRNITFTHGTVLNLDGDGTTTALDWFGVNFTDCATVGTIQRVCGCGYMEQNGNHCEDGAHSL